MLEIKHIRKTFNAATMQIGENLALAARRGQRGQRQASPVLKFKRSASVRRSVFRRAGAPRKRRP